MICNHCGNQKWFQALVTYYEPVEIWEFQENGGMNRYNNPETGDLEIRLSCPVCNSNDIDHQGYDVRTFVESPLHRLDGEHWESKVKESEQKEA